MQINPIDYFKKIFPRARDTHKGDYGKVLVISGSLGMTGAAYLCSLSTLRAGAGLVYLAIPESLNPILEPMLPEVITIPLPETRGKSLSMRGLVTIRDLMVDMDFILMGPGLSRNKETQQLIREIVSICDKPMLLDADAINAYEGKVQLLKEGCPSNLILTPHPGEFSRLTGLSMAEIKEKREGLCRKFSQEYQLTLVLKGYKTLVVSAKGDIYINETGNPGMATAGSGDVLAGTIAGLRAQGLGDFEAACLGVYIHGKAGDIAVEDVGEISLVASDILKNLPKAFKELGIQEGED